MYYGPKIVTSGLVLCLDAANKRSYPGTGTTWTDLSGNSNTGTLTNGPTFSAGNMGSIVFDGTNDYVNISSLITGNQSFSWGAWINPTATGTPVLFGNVSNGLAMISYWDSANNKVRVGTYGNDILTSGTAIPPSTWGYTCWTWNGTTLTSYTNGIADGTAAGFSFNISNLYTTIGNSVNSQYFTGRIAQTLVYNRALSESEILKNYNATAVRFGMPVKSLDGLYMVATGGDLITTSGSYKIHQFTTVGTSNFTVSRVGSTPSVEYLIVGGGGGGGGITNGGTGGGGAGGEYSGISSGGLGGGGNNSYPGSVNTGGGGSGTQRGGVPLTGFKGGSGIVIIKYRYTN